MAIRLRSRRVRTFCALGTSTFLTPMILSAPALAQAPAADAAAADAAAAEAEQGLGEIVVTATRRAQSIQKVPI